jgi:hypothetical protein
MYSLIRKESNSVGNILNCCVFGFRIFVLVSLFVDKQMVHAMTRLPPVIIITDFVFPSLLRNNNPTNFSDYDSAPKKQKMFYLEHIYAAIAELVRYFLKSVIFRVPVSFRYL